MRTIDADAAIDALRGYLVEKRCPDDGTLTCRLIENEVINKLPSIQPETNCSEIPNNSDTISRQAVTKFLNDWLSCLFENCHKQSASDLKMIIKDFKNLPSVQPEIIRCENCVNYIDNRCTVANHHVAPFSCCQSVFGAKTRGDKHGN